MLFIVQNNCTALIHLETNLLKGYVSVKAHYQSCDIIASSKIFIRLYYQAIYLSQYFELMINGITLDCIT